MSESHITPVLIPDSLQGNSDRTSLEHTLNQLHIAVSTLADLRKNDFVLLQSRHEQLLHRIEAFEQNLPSKSDVITQMADLRQRVNDIQAMESSLREASLQTIRNSFQAEASVIEQKLALGSLQRYSALDSKIEKTELTLQSKANEFRSSVEAQIKVSETNLKGEIKGVEQSLDSKIKSHVQQGIMWGLGIISIIIAVAVAILKFV